MYNILGFEFYSLGEDCLGKNGHLRYEGFGVFLLWTLFFGCLFAASKELGNWWHAKGALEFALRESMGNVKDSSFAVNQRKFKEEGWKLKVTSLITAFGIYTMALSTEVRAMERAVGSHWNQRYPQQLTPLMDWYYRAALGYHSYRTVNQFFEARRKDFIPLMAHHWMTIGMILFSKLYQTTETGAVVMVVHDNSDMLLAAGKYLTYCGKPVKVLRDAVFGLFFISWIASRIGAYSYFVLYPYVQMKEYSCHIAYWLFYPPLFGLLVLHFYWFIPILRIAKGLIHNLATGSGEVGDVRSDEERFHKKLKGRKGE